MIDIQTFATLPAKACFVLLTDGQGLPNRMNPTVHFLNILNLRRCFSSYNNDDCRMLGYSWSLQTTRPAQWFVFYHDLWSLQTNISCN